MKTKKIINSGVKEMKDTAKDHEERTGHKDYFIGAGTIFCFDCQRNQELKNEVQQ